MGDSEGVVVAVGYCWVEIVAHFSFGGGFKGVLVGRGRVLRALRSRISGG